MSEMIEKATQVLFDLEMSDGDPFAAWIELNTDDPRAACRHIVRAVIEAMREPTEEMITAGLYTEGHVPEDEANRLSQSMTYTAMIDAALSVSDGSPEGVKTQSGLIEDDSAVTEGQTPYPSPSLQEGERG